MAISDLLNRQVRALPDEDEEVYSDSLTFDHTNDGEHAEESDSEDISHGSLPDTDESANELGGPEADDDEDDSEEDGEDSEDDTRPDDDVRASLSNISFGALAKAQASLGPKSKRSSKSTAAMDEPSTASPLDDIRARIREAREQKRHLSSKSSDGKKPARSSKHAPMIQSSKHAVSRKRTIVEPPAVPKSRDPRFDPTVLSNSSRHNPTAANKAYAFLDDYRAAELKELKEKFAKTKNPVEKEALKRTIRSTSDRLRAIENQKREQEILADHKQKEKQLIREGKKSNPYYMKKSDLKKQVLLKKYENMNSKERMKALERRRKKVAAKERKEMPMERRGFDGDDSPLNEGGGGKRRRIA